MKFFYLYKDSQNESTCNVTASGLIKSFSDNGCFVLSESEFLSSDVMPGAEDVVIAYISLKNDECQKKLLSLNCKKILQSVDESKSDKILFKTQLEFCKKFGIDLMINTYPSERNMNFLSENGIKTITMPISAHPRLVDYSKKDIDVLVSGQLDSNYYPVRNKIFAALKNHNFNYAFLPHSGMETSNAIHQCYGQNFLDLLDRCWIGVTCRAGSFRDRLVAKYVEFGFSKVLPVGDCPTYMDPGMKSSMLEVTEDSSEEFIVDQIKSALADKQSLIARIENYSAIVHKNFNMDLNTKKVLRMITDNQSDS